MQTEEIETYVPLADRLREVFGRPHEGYRYREHSVMHLAGVTTESVTTRAAPLDYVGVMAALGMRACATYLDDDGDTVSVYRGPSVAPRAEVLPELAAEVLEPVKQLEVTRSISPSTAGVTTTARRVDGTVVYDLQSIDEIRAEVLAVGERLADYAEPPRPQPKSAPSASTIRRHMGHLLACDEPGSRDGTRASKAAIGPAATAYWEARWARSDRRVRAD